MMTYDDYLMTMNCIPNMFGVEWVSYLSSNMYIIYTYIYIFINTERDVVEGCFCCFYDVLNNSLKKASLVTISSNAHSIYYFCDTFNYLA